MPTADPRIAIIGAGRLGTVLAVAVHQAGYRIVACASRSLASAVALARLIPGCRALQSPTMAAQAADVVFLTVPDDAIAVVEAEIPWTASQLVIHCSGAEPAAILDSALRAGARVAGFHPLQTFADLEGGLANLPASAIGIEADEASWPWLSELARQLDTHPLRISSEHRARYHAASVLVSNGTVGLVALGAELWKTLGIDRDTAVKALLPLLRGTVRNIESLGVPGALTGPVLRGDVGTVQKQSQALSDDPRALSVYNALADWLIELAIERGTITPKQVAALRAALTSAPPAESPR